MPSKAEQKLQEADTARITDDLEAQVSASDDKRITTMQRESKLNRIAGDLPDDTNALWLFTEHSMVQEAISGIDVGRGLLKLKELLPHGDFMEGLELRKIPARTARRKMAIAVRFADRSEKLLNLGRTKLYACLDFDDDQLDALEEGKSVLDHDLDEYERMSSREMIIALKKKDVDLGVKDQLLESKNTQIDDIAQENSHLRGDVANGDEPSPRMQDIESKKANILLSLMGLKNAALRMESAAERGEEPAREEYFALQAASEAIRNELAQVIDALYNCGGGYQASIAQAGMLSDTEG